MFCPCDGRKLGAWFPKYHDTEPCSCGTCVGQPNYCVTDGAFIGTRQSHAMHFEAKYRSLVSDAHQEVTV